MTTAERFREASPYCRPGLPVLSLPWASSSSIASCNNCRRCTVKALDGTAILLGLLLLGSSRGELQVVHVDVMVAQLGHPVSEIIRQGGLLDHLGDRPLRFFEGVF